MNELKNDLRSIKKDFTRLELMKFYDEAPIGRPLLLLL